MLSVLVRSPDRRIITPAEIAADEEANAGNPSLAERQKLSDDVSAKLVAMYRGREPWRQTYAEQIAESDGERIPARRYPVEGTPRVWMGTAALARGLYRVEGRCRHELRRDPTISGLAASAQRPLYAGIDFGKLPLALGETDFRLPTYIAGYLPPGSLNEAWSASTAYTVGQSTSYGDPAPATGGWVKSNDSGCSLLFECTTSGTSHSSEPTWPLSMEEWVPEFAYSSLQWVAPPTSALVFEPTTPGTSGADSEPDWPETAGKTVVDGSITWTARSSMEIADGTAVWTGRTAFEFPLGIRKAALLLARIIRQIDQAGSCENHEEKMKAVMHCLAGAC